MTGRDQAERPIEELVAANAFRDALKPQADALHFGAPLWHGWALFNAFLAGVDYARKADLQKSSEAHRGARGGP